MRYIALLLALLVARPALADGLAVMPKWHMNNGEACYDLEGAKELVLLDRELAKCQTYPRLIENLKLEVGELKVALQTQQVALEKANVDRDVLRGQYTNCIDERAKAEASAAKSSWGWLVAGAVTLFLGGMATGWYLIHAP